MSCRHDLAIGNCRQCYPRTGTIDPGPEEEYEPNLEGPGAITLEEYRVSQSRGSPREAASARSLVLTSYMSGDHVPYSNMLRDGATDVELGQIMPYVLCELVAESGAQDGDEIEITVRRTGRRPFGDRKVRLVRPHTYEREP